MSLLQRIGRVLAVAAAAALLPFTAQAALSADERAAVARAEAYLNAITTLKARFMQVSPDGAFAEGVAYLARPGRLRLDYAPPAQIQVIADGRFLIYHDKQLEQTSYIGLNQTPAGILVQPHVSLDGRQVKVVDVSRGQGVVNITLVQAKDPGAGQITLTFSEKPFELRQWQVRDPQGQVTTISLFEQQAGLALDPKLFRFVDPNFRGPQYND